MNKKLKITSYATLHSLFVTSFFVSSVRSRNRQPFVFERDEIYLTSNLLVFFVIKCGAIEAHVVFHSPFRIINFLLNIPGYFSVINVTESVPYVFIFRKFHTWKLLIKNSFNLTPIGFVKLNTILEFVFHVVEECVWETSFQLLKIHRKSSMTQTFIHPSAISDFLHK